MSDAWPPLTELTPVDRAPRRARGHPEDKLQAGVWKALRVLLAPEVVCWSMENRHVGMLEGQRRRARGCIAGVPDMQLAWPMGQVTMLELKAPNGTVSPDQRAMHARLRAAGVEVGICRSLDEVLAFLRRQGVPMRVAT